MPRREDTVARLMAEALAGQLPRPIVLRRAAALDLCDPLVGALLAAQSRTSRAPARPHERRPEIAAAKVLTKSFI